ncbi:hypothetical protein L2E82_36087 [Cichorium intybus]|uniref:Uncharacterized protein n=1 Tax=Cichorium intybus TaxID=13427 RepID=A0ACB9BQS4_CICIN|nr:hypothetical protein L2E82_36087 [Cichorium intybus]
MENEEGEMQRKERVSWMNSLQVFEAVMQNFVNDDQRQQEESDEIMLQLFNVEKKRKRACTLQIAMKKKMMLTWNGHKFLWRIVHPAVGIVCHQQQNPKALHSLSKGLQKDCNGKNGHVLVEQQQRRPIPWYLTTPVFHSLLQQPLTFAMKTSGVQGLITWEPYGPRWLYRGIKVLPGGLKPKAVACRPSVPTQIHP